MKRILYTFPLNPIEKFSGSQTRAVTLLKYFKDRGMKVDFISQQDVWEKTTPENVAAFRNSGMVEQAWFWKRKPEKKNPVTYFFSYKLKQLLFNRKLKPVKGSIPNHTNLYLRRHFDEVLEHNSYDYIIISYVYWADLIKDNPKIGNAVTILDTHDLVTSQHQRDKRFNIGASLGDELRRLSLFDQVWACSPEEKYFFGQFLENDVRYIPTMVEEAPVSHTQTKKEFDLIYVASHNPHNLASAAWFFKEVYPLLPDTISFCIIGKIVPHIPAGLKNVTLIPFAEDLSEYYFKSRVALCPMLSGTGVKVKVLEALSYGMPIVCNAHGLDGMPDKSNNGCLVTEDPGEFAGFIQQLLKDPAFYAEQSAFSTASFRKNFSADRVYKLLDTALQVKEAPEM
ncbi:MAG TPA: glycosyltransferase [Chitinophaga sp.]|uniref:glycosyltransferase n=1 Tax=Chitinophaga sp. TaxID=1869181 RepID=UPI002B78E3CA|nr:glycosyltransferase [Chitinophaga sp.]HVI43716.1 glycosyltransferase [Chitinophaga sp.]